MNSFAFFFPIGVQHILDVKGIDHILFVAALTLSQSVNTWKHLLLTITAFTIGHSITLALSTMNIANISTAWVEFLIPITIIISACINLQNLSTSNKLPFRLSYLITLFFGLIHGLGFSTLLKSMLGKQSSIVAPLLGFNLGLELGQIIIVITILFISFIFVNVFKTKQQSLVQFVCGAIVALSIQMALNRIPF